MVILIACSMRIALLLLAATSLHQHNLNEIVTMRAFQNATHPPRARVALKLVCIYRRLRAACLLPTEPVRFVDLHFSHAGGSVAASQRRRRRREWTQMGASEGRRTKRRLTHARRGKCAVVYAPRRIVGKLAH